MRVDQALTARQRRFYDTMGPAAFHGAVPFRLSTSKAMAKLVLEVGQTFARALGRRRLRIVDLGAGSGRLTFHLASRAPAEVSFVLVDGSAAMVESWAAHRDLQPLVASGRAQLGHARVETVDSIGDLLQVEPDEALLVVGTYLFDSLPSLLLDAEQGALQGEPFLRSWAARLRHGRAFVPTGALQLLSRLEHTVKQPTLMLWGDKGGRALDQTREGEALRVASHQGGASVFVNFDALACWLGWRGCAEAPDNEPDFVIGATLLARKAWRLDELIGDALSSAVHPLRAQKAVTALRGAEARVLICAVLALEPDGDVLLELADSLVAAAAGAGAQLPASQRHALGAWLLDAVRSAFYLPADDVAFQAGRVLHMLGFAGAAASCFGHSLAHHHEHASARFNLAVCLAELGELTEATRALHQVLATDPTHARARELLVHLGELSLGPAP